MASPWDYQLFAVSVSNLEEGTGPLLGLCEAAFRAIT